MNVASPRSDIRVDGFLWEFEAGGNVEHLARHDVSMTNVYEVLRFGPVYFRNASKYAATHAMVGRDPRNRSLIIYLLPTSESGIWKPVTGWRSRLARQILQQEGRL